MVKRIIRGLFALGFMALIGLGGHFVLKQQRRVESLSAETTAIVLSKQIISRSKHTGGTSGKTTCYHKPIVHFRFEVQDRTFSSTSIFPHDFEVGGMMVFTRAPLDKFEVDQETKAYYNPDDPKQACLVRRPSWEPYAGVLGSMIALCIVLATWPLQQTQGSAARRWKALLIAVLWHAVGLAVAGHYFYLAGLDYGGGALLLFGFYTLLGLMPVGTVLRESKSSDLAGRLQGAVMASLFGTLFGFWVGFAANYLAAFFRASATVRIRCMGYGMAIPAVLFLIVGLLFAKESEPNGEGEADELSERIRAAQDSESDGRGQ